MFAVSLEDWERVFNAKLAQIDLLGELCPSAEEVEAIGKQIGALVSQSPSWQEAAEQLQRSFRLCYAVFLVGMGIYHYDEGDFWSGVCKVAGVSLSPPQKAVWGRLFESIVRELPVAQFADAGGHRYVGQILAHCGIPDERLEDFFNHVLEPLISEPKYADASVEEFLRERLSLRSLPTYVGRPVARFLEHAGDIAVDFLERCVEMARRLDQEIEASPESFGLPDRVVQTFKSWRAKKAEPQNAGLPRLRSPRLQLRPWDEGVCLHLPAQLLPGLDAETVEWQIGSEAFGEEPRVVSPAQWRTGDGYELDESYTALPMLSATYSVRLVVKRVGEDEQIIKCWTFTPFQAEDLALWFDPSNGKAVSKRSQLPKKQLWVMRRAEVKLESEDELHITESLPSLVTQEGEFVVEAVDLSEARVVRALAGEVRREWVVGRQPPPRLEPAALHVTGEGGRPAFIGAMPRLRIPGQASIDPTRWHIKLSHHRMPRPYQTSLAALELERDGADAIADLNRAFQACLPGVYELVLKGPLGTNETLEFVVLPQLEIAGLEQVYDPSPGEHAKLLIETDAATCIKPQVESQTQVRLETRDSSVQWYEVSAPLEEERFMLLLEHQTPEGLMSLPLSMPVRCMRWKTVLDPSSPLRWSVKVLDLSVQALEQSKAPQLIVDVSGLHEELSAARLTIRDNSGRVLQKQPLKRTSGKLVSELGAFLDTLRAQPSTVTLRLEAERQGKSVVQPVARVSPCLVARNLTVASSLEASGIRLVLSWDVSAGRADEWVAKLKPLWRPWATPLEITLPSGGQHEISLPESDLPPGKYALRIASRDSWDRNAACVEAHPVCLVALPEDAAVRRRAQLERAMAQPSKAFAAHLEMAYLQQDIGESADASIRWCFEHLDEGSIVQMLAFADLTQAHADWCEATRLKLSAPRRLQRVLDAHRRGELDALTVQDYLRRLPAPDRWHDETCALLLEAPDDELRRKALEQIVQRRGEGWVRRVVACVAAGWLLAREAAEKLSPALDQAISDLRAALTEHRQAALAVLEALEPRHRAHTAALLVRTGYWVRCLAGWGKLTRIESASGEALPYFLPDLPEPAARLHILLRAHAPDAQEEAILHLSEGRLELRGVKQACQCTRCNHFISQDERLFHYHTRAVHGGAGSGFKFVTLPVKAGKLEFRPEQPEQPFE